MRPRLAEAAGDDAGAAAVEERSAALQIRI